MLNEADFEWRERLTKFSNSMIDLIYFDKDMLDKAIAEKNRFKNSLNEMLDDAKMIGLRRGYQPYLGGLAVLHRLDDELEAAQQGAQRTGASSPSKKRYSSSHVGGRRARR